MGFVGGIVVAVGVIFVLLLIIGWIAEHTDASAAPPPPVPQAPTEADLVREVEAEAEAMVEAARYEGQQYGHDLDAQYARAQAWAEEYVASAKKQMEADWS